MPARINVGEDQKMPVGEWVATLLECNSLSAIVEPDWPEKVGSFSYLVNQKR